MRETNVLLVMFLSLGTASLASQPSVEGISTTGTAAVEVSPDRLQIDFELLTERESFAEAANAARQMASQLKKISFPDHALSISVQYDLTFMRQKKWGKGRKLEHRFRMTVRDVPDERAQEVLVHLVDTALRLHPQLTVERFETSLSDAKSLRVRTELLQQAVKDARNNAAVLADAANLRLKSPRQIAVGPSDQMVGGRFYNVGRLREGVVFGRATPFTVNTELASVIRVSVAVFVDFHVEPL